MPGTLPSGSPRPEREPLDAAWAAVHGALHEAIREAIRALPNYFRTETMIAGIVATDVHTLNTVLGATIEEQVVKVLNSMRDVWDPDERYTNYRFIRQAQTLPDVLFRKIGSSGCEGILFGIELKGWCLLAKEGEPSLRFTATQEALTTQDLVVVVPWALSSVISGTPTVFAPWIEPARYCAAMRNYYWQELRAPTQRINREIAVATGVGPYPKKTDKIADIPGSDSGNNFGRLARSRFMDDYTSAMLETPLCGIPVQYWLDFFRAFRDNSTTAQIEQDIADLAARAASIVPGDPRRIALERIVEAVVSLVGDEGFNDDERAAG